MYFISYCAGGVGSWCVLATFLPTFKGTCLPGNSGMWHSLSTTSFLESFVTLLCISSMCTWILMNQLCLFLLKMFLGHLQVIHDDWYHLLLITDSCKLADTYHLLLIIDSCKLAITCKTVCLCNSHIHNHKTAWSAAQHQCCL